MHPENLLRDWALVGVAGPLSNLLIAVLLCGLLALLRGLGVLGPSSGATQVLALGIFVNVLLALFNLIPVPPLDGSRVVQYFLSGAGLAAYRWLERYGLLLILALVLLVPGFQRGLVTLLFAVVGLLGEAFGITGDLSLALRGPAEGAA